MASAKIGALHVSLGLDSASFEAGLKKAQGGMNKWQAAMVGATVAVAAAAAAAGVALSRAMGDAINRFDDMGKTAQKVGLSVEALSRLEYAARLSDVSLETLSTSLTRLSNNLGQVAQGSKGPAASALAALGIAATDATGKLRASDEVLADIAERFVRMEDGTTKTALAVQLFGRSGAELIPLLNSGRDGLKEMADEADRLGITLDTQATKNAEIFNDNITRVNAAVEGVVNTITTAALPVLTYLSEKFVEAAGNGDLLQAFANGFVFVLQSVVSATAIAVTAVASLGEAFSTLMNAARLAQVGYWDAAGKVLEKGFGGIQENVAATISFVEGLWAAIDLPEGSDSPIKPFTVDMDALATSTKAATDAQKQFNQVMSEGQRVFMETRDPLEKMQLDLDRLGHLLNQRAIDWETYGRAVNAVTMNGAAAALGMASQVSGALAGLFKDNKAFAVANAVINTAEGATKALAQGGIWGFAGAAAVVASGAAQIMSIMSAQPGSATLAPSPSMQTAVQESAPAGGSINVTLAGSGRYSRDEVRDLLEQIGDFYGDRGQQIVVSPA